MDTWKIKEEGFQKEHVELNGSRFTIGNGNFGYRGTLDEFSAKELVALTIAGVYDDANGWREIVNAPNPLYARLRYKEEVFSVLTSSVLEHEQELDIKTGCLRRRTVFEAKDGNRLTLESRRMCGWEERNLLLAKYCITSEKAAEVTLEVGFDKEIWECNGPHFTSLEYKAESGMLRFQGVTGECKKEILEDCFCKSVKAEDAGVFEDERFFLKRYCFSLEEGEEAILEKWVSIRTEGRDRPDTERNFAEDWKEIVAQKEKIWETFDVEIEGDEEAQLGIRHSQYLLLLAAPFGKEAIAIPARGLSGQVYKGAMFWDTELYMLPMFLYEFPEVARNLVLYRIKNLQGALDKAKEYGYYGAFFPWESQETGQEGCTEYNLTDIFTGRKVRTYFRDKQIHISADVAYGIWKYYEATGDLSILEEGGARTLFECACFFCSYAYYKKDKGRYEFPDVTGADEYHERVGNDLYTNGMIRHCMRITRLAIEEVKAKAPKTFEEISALPDFEERRKEIADIEENIYFPEPNEDGVLEQFDGFFRLEDCSIEEIRKRIINPNEYLGSPTGLCVETQISKQADVVLLMSTLPEEFSQESKEKNFAYYEPRTEHGSSLSTCIYALLAAQMGEIDWAYQYFMRAACLDWKGDYKLYLGPLYIGGTHPAANGGAWRVLIEGFAGLQMKGEKITLSPRLPKHWKGLRFHIKVREKTYRISIGETGYEISEHLF